VVTIAFHFRAKAETPGTNYAWDIQRWFFQQLLASTDEDVHLEVMTGDLITESGEATSETVLQSLLGYDPRRFNTLDREEFAGVMSTADIYVLAVEGMSRKQRDHVDANLRRRSSYLGALEVDPANQVHWALYRRRLVPRYRYFNREIRLFYRKFEEDAEVDADVRDFGLFKALKDLPFQSVGWEDMGVRHTIFDSFQSFAHARRIGELEDFLSGHLAHVADEVLLRTAVLDPGLRDTLYAALKTLERIQTGEEIAQVAVSCRRFLEGLANALYPPRKEPVKGRSVGPEGYRNRLWAYVEDNLLGDERGLVLAQLKDIGNRLDRLDSLANKGVHHRITSSDVRRLILGVVILAYDLFSLKPPPIETPLEPYSEAIEDFGRRVIRHRKTSNTEDDRDPQ
jgi:hypothetical protein